jgi:hypothetical protein
VTGKVVDGQVGRHLALLKVNRMIMLRVGRYNASPSAAKIVT